MCLNKKTSGLENIKKNTEKLKGKREVKMTDTITPDFLSKCSNFKNLEDMFEKSNFKIESADDYKNIPDKEWDIFISKNTSYESWAKMRKEASIEYIRRLLHGLDKPYKEL